MKKDLSTKAPFSKAEYCQRRSLECFLTWIKDVRQKISDDSELARKIRAGGSNDKLINLFSKEAVPLSFFLKHRGQKKVEVVLSADDEAWDAALFVGNSEERIQITTTENPARALTRHHVNVFGWAPGTHAKQSEVDLAKWKKEPKEVEFVAVNARVEVEEEAKLVAQRIQKKLDCRYSTGMTLLVYSRLDLTEEHFSEEEMRARVLSSLGDTRLNTFAHIYLTQFRRNVQIK
jgi:hypothetical protein